MPDLLNLRPEPNDGLPPPQENTYEMEHGEGGEISRSDSRQLLLGQLSSATTSGEKQGEGGLVKGMARHTLGLLLLLCVVFLWTLSNFLGSVCHTACYPADHVLRPFLHRASTDILIFRVSSQTARMINPPSSHGSTAHPSCSPWYPHWSRARIDYAVMASGKTKCSGSKTDTKEAASDSSSKKTTTLPRPLQMKNKSPSSNHPTTMITTETLVHSHQTLPPTANVPTWPSFPPHVSPSSSASSGSLPTTSPWPASDTPPSPPPPS